ncbi:TMEM175 family protein [Micromonospora chersina]|uniref:TMEM175 family protein n=1 Tax=Micromonospora chersina TaxID=47854 RepID=UPI00372217FD
MARGGMPWSRTDGGDRTDRRSAPVGAERNPRRVVGFSDAVVAIAVTLLVLEIRPPEDTRHLWHGLRELWPSYAAYVLTFLLIGQMWVNHHVMFDHIRAADRLVLLLNTLLLMQIAFLPFASAVLAGAFKSGHGQRTAVVFYGISYEVAAILFNVIWEYARHGRRLLDRDTDSAAAAAISRRFRPAPVWIAAGTALGAWHPVLGLVVFAAFVPFYWWPIKGEVASIRRAREHASGESA